MKRTELLKHIPPQSAPLRQSEDVLAVSRVAEYEGVRYLNIDLFYRGRLRGRYFADTESHAASIDGAWYTCTFDNVARICKVEIPIRGSDYWREREWAWNTEQDKKTVQEYLEGSDLYDYEYRINQTKYKRAYLRKRRRVEELMNRIPVVPEDAETWLRETVFPQEYLFFRKKESRTEYGCTACGGHGWKKRGWKHNEKTVCPKCGQPVTAYSRKQQITKMIPVVILQAMEQEWVERQMKAVCSWEAGEKKTIRLYEEIRAVIPEGSTFGKVWYGCACEADEYEQDFWDKNQINKRWNRSLLYPGNLSEVLPYGNLERSGLKQLAEAGVRVNVNAFLLVFHKKPWLEYLIKAGLTRLAAEMVERGWWGYDGEIYDHAGNLRECLELDGNRTNRIKQLNGGWNMLGWLQYEEKMERLGKRIRISRESLEYLDRKNISKSECEEILRVLESVERMVNYMKKQNVSPKRLIGLWKDYLAMARAEGLDTADDIVRLPKDVKARHDELVERRNVQAMEERIERDREEHRRLDERIGKHLTETARYQWEDKSYRIIPAETCEELIREGQALHHCVGSSNRYMLRMAEGESWILFLRKKEETGKPYYTIEISMKDDRIIQYYSEYDRQPDKAEIDRILRIYKADLKKKQVAVRIPETATA